MKIKLKKKDNGEYQATFTVDFDLGEIDIKLPEGARKNGKIVIQTGANVQQMKKLFKENLEQNIDMYDKETRERFEDMLSEYVRYDLFEKLQLEKIPPRVVLDKKGEVKDIDGLIEGAEYEIVQE
jgi:ABC-type microcin C transport system permease subunit YejB